MSSTPLFDSIARHIDHTAPARITPTPSTARATSAPAPTSPMSAPVEAKDSVLVPAALVAAIEEIPVRATAVFETEHTVRAEQLALVDAVADAITRAVVDAVAIELEHIARDGVVRV